MFAQMLAVVLISLMVLVIGGCAKQGYYTGIAALDGGKIPITKLPSILERGKLIDMCNKGQTPYLDHCFDTVHLDAERAGFRLESKTRTFEAWTTASQKWLETFTTVSTWNGNNLSHGYRLTYTCNDWSSSCAIPSWFRKLLTRKIGKTHYISYLTLYTHYRWGGLLTGRTTYSWPVQGTLTMKGKPYSLPVTRKQVKDVYGHPSPTRTANKYLEVHFNYDCDPAILPNCSVNNDDKLLMHISYEADNYQREEDINHHSP